MATTVQQLVDQVLSEGQFDATQDQALRWLSVRQRQMVARSRSLRKTVSVGPTVAGQRDYALPGEVVEIQEVTVNGLTWGKGTHVDLSRGAQGYLRLSESGGIVASEETAAGGTEIALYPTPTEAGLPIEVRATFLPADLSVGDDATLVIPGDYVDALVSGAIATALVRLENRPDLAQYHEGVFSSANEELRRMVSRRYRGPGPATIRVRGINA